MDVTTSPTTRSAFGSQVDLGGLLMASTRNGLKQIDPRNNLGKFMHLELQDLQLSGFAPSIPPDTLAFPSIVTE
jgi:hypothetical protein